MPNIEFTCLLTIFHCIKCSLVPLRWNIFVSMLMYIWIKKIIICYFIILMDLIRKICFFCRTIHLMLCLILQHIWFHFHNKCNIPRCQGHHHKTETHLYIHSHLLGLTFCILLVCNTLVNLNNLLLDW